MGSELGYSRGAGMDCQPMKASEGRAGQSSEAHNPPSPDAVPHRFLPYRFLPYRFLAFCPHSPPCTQYQWLPPSHLHPDLNGLQLRSVVGSTRMLQYLPAAAVAAKAHPGGHPPASSLYRNTIVRCGGRRHVIRKAIAVAAADGSASFPCWRQQHATFASSGFAGTQT